MKSCRVLNVDPGELCRFYTERLALLGDVAARHAGGDYSRITVTESMNGDLLKLVRVDNAPFGEIWVDSTTRPPTIRSRITVGEDHGDTTAEFPNAKPRRIT